MSTAGEAAMMAIGRRRIGPGESPFLIAEMSGNHNQSLERALAIIDAAADSGADAVKLQTYTADTMTLDCDTDDFVINDHNSLWHGQRLYDLFARASTPWEWHETLYGRCRERGMLAFSTPFDDSAVEFLERLNTPCYKIASFEMTDLPLVQRVAATGKPMIISTGMATVDEIDEAISTARSHGAQDIVLLKCTSTYPASPKDTNILTIPDMQRRFDCLVGLSDHTLGIGTSVASIALGAVVIEKHFVLNRANGGPDAEFSMEPAEFKQLVQEAERAWQSLGEVSYGAKGREQGFLQFRRSIYVTRDTKAGESLTRDNIRVIRPGFGLAPRHFDELLGKRLRRDCRRGHALSWDDICPGD